MPVANPKKTINASSMSCGDVANMTLKFQTAASLALNPADILLIIDRSSALNDEDMTLLKTAAKNFIDMVDGARNGSVRMGIESFADSATEDVKLSNNFSMLKSAIDALKASGTANYKVAWETAIKMLGISTSQRQVAVMFTASVPESGGGADKAVKTLKDKGVEIFCIGLGANTAPLNLWASDPDRIHVAHTDNPDGLNNVFRKIGEEVVLAGVRDGLIKEQLMPEFKIIKVYDPDVGTVEVTGPQTLTWSIGAAGIKDQPNYESLSFDIMYIGDSTGILPVNHSVIYSDREGNSLNFPSPTVEVKCSGGEELYPEPCPAPTEFEVPGCKDSANVLIAAASLQSLGRIVQVDVTLKSVCPGKRVAACIILTEITPDGIELNRGVKHILVPAQIGETCSDITLKCISFSLPEELDATGNTASICNSRKFAARVIANYVDTDFICC